MKSMFRFDPNLVCRGTEEFWVPALLAAAGSGVSYANTKAAQGREQSGEVQNILDQQKLQSQGNAQVKALTNKIAQNSPTSIASKATGDYVSALRKNAAGSQTGGGNSADILFGAPTSSLPTNVNGSSRYKADAAGAQDQTEKYGSELASEMGNIDAATRMRQNEGLDMSTLGSNLSLLGAQSYTNNFVNQLRSQVSGQTNPWLSMLSGVLSGAGNTMSKNTKGPVPPPPVSLTSQYSGGYQPTGGAPDVISGAG